jgi:hypothetical protein
MLRFSCCSEAYKASKEAGGWTPSLLMHRYQELAFGCLFVHPARNEAPSTTPLPTVAVKIENVEVDASGAIEVVEGMDVT